MIIGRDRALPCLYFFIPMVCLFFEIQLFRFELNDPAKNKPLFARAKYRGVFSVLIVVGIKSCGLVAVIPLKTPKSFKLTPALARDSTCNW